MENKGSSSISFVLDIIGALIITVAFFGGIAFLFNEKNIVLSAITIFAGFSAGVVFIAIGKIIEYLQDSVDVQNDILLKLNESVQKMDYIIWSNNQKKMN